MEGAVLPVVTATPEVLALYKFRFDANLPPSDAQEYLWRVRQEAETIPDITTVPIDKITKTLEIPSVSDTFLPELPPCSTEKQLGEAESMEILSEFADIRQYLVHIEASYNIPRRMQVCKLSDEDGWRRIFQSTAPHVNILLQMDQIMTRKLLHTMLHWIEEDAINLSRLRGVWIYALLARLDKPLLAEMDACVRDIFRWCWKMRNLVDGDVETLNVILCICSFFGQGEAINFL
ncbi:hypothetical protein THRCLA_07312 [Thraustotheca clavata]|uniref:Gem-associated protein 2 n=1 Tax=Thraustotheca clavata TaxID=74557 RepID=A0A1V9ZEB2_9STRA|nr:hypothetical protein THRCLA_07312 [Thraustotheca clavata]